MGEPFQRGRFDALPELPRRPHDYHGTEAHDVVVDSASFGPIRTHYRALGSGPPLLLIHGLMTSSYSWRYVIAPLAERFRVFVPDLPGAGQTDKPTNRVYSATHLAAWIGEFQRTVKIRGCPVIGNSLGGYLCMRLALADPDAISRLVNIHSPAFAEPRLKALHAALCIPGIKAGLAAWVRRDPERWAHANVHYYDETLKSREEARAFGAPLATPDGARAFVRYLADALAPAELAEFIQTLKQRKADNAGFTAPLLLIYARQDPMVAPHIGQRLSALLPKAEVVWLEHSSHFAHVDSPERLLKPVLEFLEV